MPSGASKPWMVLLVLVNQHNVSHNVEISQENAPGLELEIKLE